MNLRNLGPSALLTLTLGSIGCPAEDDGNDDAADTGSTGALDTGTDDTGPGPGDSSDGTDTGTADTGDETSDTTAAAQLEITVNYAGAGTGLLTVAAFSMWPAAGPPSAFAQDMAPTFPGTWELSGLPAGDYYVFATLDVAPESGFVPGEEDPQVVTDAVVTIEDGAAPVAVELTLTDPE